MRILKRIKRIYHMLQGRITNEELNEYLKKHDLSIGKKTVFFDARSTFVDTQRPWMLEIGEYCKITRGCVILQHDYSRSVLRRVYGDVIDGCTKTTIGNNVFIGMNSIILMGASIGDNVIIGAGSVVSGCIPSNSVAAGNPAKVIRSLDEHYKMRKERYVDEAKKTAKEYFEKYEVKPSIKDMGGFFPIYLERSVEALKQSEVRTNLSADEEEEVIAEFLKSTSVYESFEAFLTDTLGDEYE